MPYSNKNFAIAPGSLRVLFSRKLSNSGSRYSAYDGLLLAVFADVKYFPRFPECYSFTVFSDHLATPHRSSRTRPFECTSAGLQPSAPGSLQVCQRDRQRLADALPRTWAIPMPSIFNAEASLKLNRPTDRNPDMSRSRNHSLSGI